MATRDLDTLYGVVGGVQTSATSPGGVQTSATSPPGGSDYIVDLRSDTVTKPSAEMYQAMISAPVGDDVMIEDPTVMLLQEKCAKMFDMEDSLFVPTGTMGNLISLMTHCSQRGKEVIMAKQSHTFLYEGGGLAQLGGVHTSTVEASPLDGTMNLDDIRNCIRNPFDDHMPETKVICLENTQNRLGGLVLPVSYFKSVRQLADEHGLSVHLDGARLMNACVAAGVEPREYTKLVDSVSVCFSKGLGAPVGSVIAGTKEFCTRARRTRKALGGGMRQVGVLAAAALYALDNNISKLKTDHERTTQLAQVVVEHGGIMAQIEMNLVHSNIAYIKMLRPDQLNSGGFVERMKTVSDEEYQKLGQRIIVKMSAFSNTDVRYVFHMNITDADAALARRKLQYVLQEINA